MKVNLPWLISAGVIGVAGFIFAGQSHQNIPVDIDKSKPGQLVVEYRQPSPGAGKLVSILCAGGVAVCLWKGIKEDDAIATSQPATVARTTTITAPKTRIQSPEEYDEDPVIEYETEEAVQPKVAIATTAKPKTELDPIKLIAQTDGKKRHIFLACQTQTGKTTTVLSAIERKHEETDGAADWTIFDPKNSAWMGLENLKDDDGTSKVVRMSYDTPSDILKMQAKLRWAIAKMTARQKQRNAKHSAGLSYNPKPHTLVFDEWPSTRKLAIFYDQENGLAGASSIWGWILRSVELLVLNGLEDGISVWMITQMPNLEQNGFDGGLRDQFAYWCQGRDGDFRSIEAAIANNWIVTGSKLRKELASQLDDWKTRDRGMPIVYSNIGGHRMFEMPDLDGIKAKRLFSASAQNNVIRFPQAVGSNYVPESLEDAWADD